MFASTDKQFQQLDIEYWIVRRIDEHTSRNRVDSPYAPRIFEGVTNAGIRRQRIRQAIIKANLDDAIIGKNPNGQPETYSEIFARFYGEPLLHKGNAP